MPFAAGNFLLAMAYERRRTARLALALGMAMLASALAKPNYVIALGPCLAGVAVWRLGRSLWLRDVAALKTQVAHATLAFTPVVLGLAGQYALMFGGHSVDSDRVLFAPFKVWGLYSPNVPASILLGIAFPLVTAVLYPRETSSDRPTLMAWAVLTVAVAQFALFAEERCLPSANFAWGSYFADYVLFLMACALLMKQPVSWRFVVACSVLTL